MMPGYLQRIPFAEIDTLFFDVGGTLVSIDFEWVQKELALLGVTCSTAQLERAEAASRPLASQKMAELHPTEVEFEFYFRTILEQLARISGQDIDALHLAGTLAPVLRPPGQSNLLWSSMLPGVQEMLQRLADMGLKLAVVSNSDGSVEKSLSKLGLRHFFEVVVDSHFLGIAKPDPGIFRHALDTLRSNPERTLHIGDMYFADVQGARRAGIHPLLLDPFEDWGDVDCERLPAASALHNKFSLKKRPSHALSKLA